MAVPEEIRMVERPVNTIVEDRGKDGRSAMRSGKETECAMSKAATLCPAMDM